MAGLAIAAIAQGAQAGPRPPKPSEVDVYLSDKPAALQPLFRNVITEGERNRVLNLDRAGLAAMANGSDDVAAGAFDQALERIEAIYSDNPKAERARSKFVRESTKDFKGEPYERAMTYYYRGLLYLGAGDYENARASFLQGQIQDAFAEDQRYKSDYAIFEMLAGWSSHCLGDEPRAAEFYANAKALREDIVAPRAADKTLLIADMGLGPQKYADGQYSENLRFRGQPYEEGRVVFLSDNASTTLMRAASDAISDQEAAGAAVRTATADSQDLAAKAQAARAMADATAQAIEARVTAMPPLPEPPTAPPAPSTPEAKPIKLTAAEKAELKAQMKAKLDASNAQATLLKARQVENNVYLSIALKAAVAADKAQTAVIESAAKIELARKAHDEALAAEKLSQAALKPYGLRVGGPLSLADAQTAAPVTAARGENLLFQATTRGGRAVDGILAGKASFKAGAEQFSNTMSQTAMIAAQTTNAMATQAQSLMAQGYNVNLDGMKGMAYASAGLSVLSMVGSMTANAAKPAADIRYWDNLPGEIVYATSPEVAGFKAVLQSEAGGYLRDLPISFRGPSGGACRLGWVRTRSASDIPVTAPNSAEVKR